ncbi:MAG: zinc-binding dehydrogenase [Gammaproteobacteria bacterium]|nr:zinc-binding dehydrogenase [Gammaproteobacteria bacterium]
MQAIVTTGHGGYDKLELRAVPIPQPAAGEVLLRVLAAGVNNTEINTRLGWYSSEVTTGTAEAASADAQGIAARNGSGWSGVTRFPLIQGTDCCGQVVALGAGVDAALLGRRSLVRPCMHVPGANPFERAWLGSDLDGGFAQFVKVPAIEVFPLECGWSDAQLATVPCAYGTAENMLRRAELARGERVLVTGASGGVGSAAVQLAMRRAASVIAIAAAAKHEPLRSLGVERLIDRDADPLATLGEESIDVVIDCVGGPALANQLRTLRRGGRYVVSGAIAGPQVSFDLRTLYLRDRRLIGATTWDEAVFPDLVSYIERGEFKPLLAGTFALERIAEAQRQFLEKRHVGNLVLIPPAPAV